MTPTVLLYDWDNTLVDAWAPIAGALNQVLAARDLPLWTIRQTRERVRTNDEDSWRAWFADDWKAARKAFARAMRTQDLSQIRPMPGADEALEAGSPIPQAVVSNKGRPFVEAEAAALGWSHRFALVVGAGDAEADKPHPAPILLALSRMNMPPSPSVWYVGDTAVDMRAARAAGVTAVLVGDGAHDAAATPDPHLHFPTAHDLARRLRARVAAPEENPG